MVQILFNIFYFFLQKSGIDKILPCMKIDDYLFEPCGYSMNGILQNDAVDYGLVSDSKLIIWAMELLECH